MVEFKIKIHPEQRLAYIPRQLVETLGFRLKAVPNSVAVLFFPENADPHDVIESLQIIKAELLHALALRQKGIVNNE
jgi:uncharacterized membrane protein